MRKLMLIAAMLFLILPASAQDTVSIVVRQQKTIENIQLHLVKAQKNHTGAVLSGLLAFGTSVLAASQGGEMDGLYYVSGGLGLTSFIFTMSAWSNIGKAGRYRYSQYDNYTPYQEEEEDWKPKKNDLSDVIKRKEY